MRFFSILVLTVLIAFSAQAQNLSLVNNYHTFWGNIYDQMGGVSFDVTNNGSSSVTLIAIRTTNNLASGHESYFCYGVRCYDSTVDTADQYITVPPGATVPSTLIHYLKPLANAGTSEVHYCLIDTNNVADSVCVRFVYNASVTGIYETVAEGIAVELSPNPATEFVKINFTTEVKVGELVNIIDARGRTVYSVRLTSIDELLIDITNWPEGLYYVGLEGKGQFGKLSVKH